MSARRIWTIGWRVALSLTAAAFVPGVFWLGGYDFNERGLTAVVCTASTALVFLRALALAFD